MPVRKKVGGEDKDVFEDVIRQDDKIVQFNISDIAPRIVRQQEIINRAQAEIDTLTARKAEADAL